MTRPEASEITGNDAGYIGLNLTGHSSSSPRSFELRRPLAETAPDGRHGRCSRPAPARPSRARGASSFTSALLLAARCQEQHQRDSERPRQPKITCSLFTEAPLVLRLRSSVRQRSGTRQLRFTYPSWIAAIVGSEPAESRSAMPRRADTRTRWYRGRWSACFKILVLDKAAAASTGCRPST